MERRAARASSDDDVYEIRKSLETNRWERNLR